MTIYGSGFPNESRAMSAKCRFPIKGQDENSIDFIGRLDTPEMAVIETGDGAEIRIGDFAKAFPSPQSPSQMSIRLSHDQLDHLIAKLVKVKE